MKKIIIFFIILLTTMGFSLEKGIYFDEKTAKEYFWLSETRLHKGGESSIEWSDYFLDIQNNALAPNNISQLVKFKNSISSKEYFDTLFDLGYSFYLEGERPYFNADLTRNYITVNPEEIDKMALSSTIKLQANPDTKDNRVIASFHSPKYEIYGFISSPGYLNDCSFYEPWLPSFAVYFTLYDEPHKGCLALRKPDKSTLINHEYIDN